MHICKEAALLLSRKNDSTFCLCGLLNLAFTKHLFNAYSGYSIVLYNVMKPSILL